MDEGRRREALRIWRSELVPQRTLPFSTRCERGIRHERDPSSIVTASWRLGVYPKATVKVGL